MHNILPDGSIVINAAPAQEKQPAAQAVNNLIASKIAPCPSPVIAQAPVVPAGDAAA